MPNTNGDFRLTMRHLMIPISLMSLTLLLLLAFQTMSVMRDRDGLNQLKGQQEQAFQDSQKLQTQLKALLLGTQKLSDQGNKNAKTIAEKLKTMGIEISAPAPAAEARKAVPAAPVPAASEDEEPGPVKP